MYIPNSMKMDSVEVAHDFIEQFGFGIIVSGSLTGTHLPFVLRKEEGQLGTLYGHCAKANPHWKELNDTDALVIFNGPHSYISPIWYAQAPAVPTWNYAAVHSFGKVTVLNNDQTIEIVEELVQQYEPSLVENTEIIPNQYRDKLSKSIVGLKIELSHLEGKLKLGQHRSIADQQGVLEALSNSKNFDDVALVNYMKKIGIGIG